MIRRLFILLFTLWFALLQTLLPAVVLAEEFIDPITPGDTTYSASSPTPAPSDEPTLSPSPYSSSPPTADLSTGDVYATSETLTTVNTTSENSSVSVVAGDITDPTQDTLVLFETPDDATPTASLAPITTDESTPSGSMLAVENTADVTTTATTAAVTGENAQYSEGDSTLTTGDAVATSYATTVANTTLINSSVEIALLTLLTEWDGNIVIDPQSLLSAPLAPSVGSLSIDNAGNVTTTADAVAVTGSNTQVAGGDASLTTGDAVVSATSTSLVNTTLVDTLLFDFYIHNLSLWSGLVFNWSAPGSRETPDTLIGRNSSSSPDQSCTACSHVTDITNTASVTTSSRALAITGGNTQVAGGTSTMTTGTAFASAKSASVVNSTLINSSYRLLDVTLFAPWTGNLIFAYPDLTVSITAPSTVRRGSTFTYTVDIANRGYKTDTGVLLTVGDHTEPLGTLESHSTVHRTYEAVAGDTRSSLVFTASVAGDLEEESLANNTATAAVAVEAHPESVSESSVSHDIPVLTLSASTNIGTHIYPGDTVRYEATILNRGPGTAYDTVFANTLVAPDGSSVGTMTALVGHIAAGTEKHISFGLVTAAALPPGDYSTVSIVTGRSDDRTSLTSNAVSLSLPVKSKIVALVAASDTPPLPSLEHVSALGTVLGSTDTHTCTTCRHAGIILALTTALSSLYTYAGRRRGSRRLLTMAIGWSGLGYMSLLVLNPECSQGITLVSGSFLCTYFLPLAFGQAVLQRVVTIQKTPSPQLANGESDV